MPFQFAEKRIFVLYDDKRGYWFVRLGLGLFWECTTTRADAREFETRDAAAKMLHKTGKHREGWRVIAESPNRCESSLTAC